MNHHDHEPRPTAVTGGISGGPPTNGERTFLGQAIELAVDNAAAGQLPFGAVVVHGGGIVATGVNTTLRDDDPTAHAEVDAIRNACRNLGSLALPGATLVSSCEPCVLCHAAAATAGIARVIYAAPSELATAMLGTPGTPHAALLAEMQRSLRALTPEQVVHLPIEGAGEPFERYTNDAPNHGA